MVDGQSTKTTPPDDDAKPDQPTDLTRRSWKFILRKTFGEFSDDQCTDLAAALTYDSVLALFPPRDTRIIEKNDAKDREELTEARAVRQDKGHHQ